MNKLIIPALCIVLASACEPEATALCDKKAECGVIFNPDECLADLHEERDMAAMSYCESAFFAYLDCQIETELTCGQNFDRVMAESCWQSKCDYEGCLVAGAGWNMMSPDPCEQMFDASGKWALTIMPDIEYGEPQCSVGGYREIVVQRSGDAFQLSAGASGFGVAVTGTIEASPAGAAMTANFTYQGSDSTVAKFTLDLFAGATPRTRRGVVPPITGSGTGTLSNCTANVKVMGQLMPASP
jgi:hypothetical protein